MTTTSSNSQITPIHVIFYIMAIGALSIALLLNWQPWLVLGEHIVNQIDIIPLIGWADRAIFQSVGARAASVVAILIAISKIKANKPWTGTIILICGVICLVSPAAFFRQLEIVVGIILWGWCQWVQLMPLFVEMAGIKKPDWIKQLRLYRVSAYVLEIFACLMLYPPYEGGVRDFLNDWGRFGAPLASKWSWVNFGWSMGTVVSVEMTLVFLVMFALQAGVIVPPSTGGPSRRSRRPKNSHPAGSPGDGGYERADYSRTHRRPTGRRRATYSSR